MCRSYYNQLEIESLIDIFDKRYPHIGLGVSMEISTDCSNSTEPLDLDEQMLRVIHQCAPIFYGYQGNSMGIGK